MRTRKKVLIVTSSYDMTVDYVISKFGDYVDFYRFNTDFFSDYEIEHNSNGFSILNGYWSIKEEEIDAIYYRKPSLPDISDYDLKYHKLMYKEILTLIEGTVEVFEGVCLTKPSILRKAENKLHQLRLANEIGFTMPESVITNSNNAAKLFCEGRESIIKPISIGKIAYENKVGIIQTNMVNKQLEINSLCLSPAYFQEYIKRDYEIRATIVNEHFYVVKIETDVQVDWRKETSRNKYDITVLPAEIKEKCKLFMNKLNISFGAFDFIVSKGEYVFLEVNPNGQWLWLEEALGINISNSIIELLTGERI